MENRYISLFVASALLLTIAILSIEREKKPEALKQTSPELLDINQKIRRLEQESQRLQTNNSLARLYLQKARLTGAHHSCIRQARQYVNRTLQENPKDPEARLMAAEIAMSKHQFEEAREISWSLTEEFSHMAAAWGVYADAQKELGYYEEAVRACDKMLALKPNLASYSRAAHLRELHGDYPGARLAMTLAAKSSAIGTEGHAWAWYHLANLYLKEGKTNVAKDIYKEILTFLPNHPFAHAGLGQIESIDGNYETAIGHLERAYEIARQHEFMEELALLHARNANTTMSKEYSAGVLEAFEAHEQEGWRVDLEYAGFCLQQGIRLKEALDRIEREYARRPQHLEVMEVYAKALHMNGKSQQALLLVDKAMERNPMDDHLIQLRQDIQAQLQTTVVLITSDKDL
jgi:tetratricopeptide (TPR) repeat protein